MFKTKILSFIFFLTVQLVLCTSVSNPAFSADGEPTDLRFEETGEASWYGPGFQSRKTASGERFDTNEMTAAHKTLPFGTLLKVTNLENNLFAVVKVNDRGPYVRGRIIDLSKAAKNAIGMSGTAQVKIEQITEEEAELLKNGIDPDEKTDLSQIDSTQFKTTSLLDTDVAADSKIFVHFESEDGTSNDFELNKNLKSNGSLKIKIITPKTEQDDEQITNLYQSIGPADSLVNFFDLSNQPAIVKGYSIVTGTYTDKSLADRKIGRLERDGFRKVYLEEISVNDPKTNTKTVTYKVLVGLYELKKTAKKEMSALTKLKYDAQITKIGE